MPIYEYRCEACAHRFSVLTGMVTETSGQASPVCPRCGSANARKLVSRFARLKSADDRVDALAAQADGLDAEDPAALREMARQIGGELGDGGEGDDLEEIIGEMQESEAAA